MQENYEEALKLYELAIKRLIIYQNVNITEAEL
jgi:hypothetical protein